MSSISTLGQSIAQIRQLSAQQEKFSTLASQLASGKKTQNFSGLKNDVLTSKRARADFKFLDSYIQNIINGDRRMQMMALSIEEVQEQTRTFSGSLISLSQEGVHQEGERILYDDPFTPEIESTPVGMTSADVDVDLNTLQDLASSLFDLVTELINTQDGDRYVLNGSDILTRPLGNTDALDSAISSLISDWKDGTITTEDLMADISSGDTSTNSDAITDTIIGFSAALGNDNVGDVSVRAADNIDIEYTVRANEDPFRDILVGLAFIKNPDLYPIADVYEPPNTYPGVPDAVGAPGETLQEMKENFFQVYNTVQTMIEGAIDGADSSRFHVETARARIEELKRDHIETKNFLGSVISEAEDVNIDQVAVEISALQVQIEASYAVTAQMQQISLVNYLR